MATLVQIGVIGGTMMTLRIEDNHDAKVLTDILLKNDYPVNLRGANS